MMWKMSNKKRKMAFLTALIGSLMAGSSVGAANLMATIPSDFDNSQMGGVTGSRVTTKVDAAPVVGAVKNLNRDPATFSVFINGESQIFLRQYTYSTVALKGSVLMDADGDWASVNNPTGEITAVPNAHVAVGYGNTLYTTGYDNGQIGLAKVNGKQLVENKLKTVNLKTDIKEKTGDVDAASYDTYTDTDGSIQTTTVHGEGLLIKDGYLYVAASVNLKSGYDNYDNGYLMQYKINSDGGLSYNGYARIGKNTDQVKLNNYNHLILNTSIGGYQNYGFGNKETSLDYVNINGNNIGNLHDKKSIILPEQVKNDGYDFRDMKVLPDGTVYVMKYTLSDVGGDNKSGFTGRVYQTTMANLMSKNPDDWNIVLAGTVGEDGGWFGRLNAEYYTKRLWVEWGNNLYVYEDGDTKPTHQWETKDFSTDKQFYQFNSVTMLPTDQVWGSLAKLTTYRPEGFTASSETKITLENADAKIGTVTRKAGITGTSADQTAFSDVISDDGTYSFTKDEVLSINLGKEGDHATNAAAVIQAKDGKDITIDASGHTLQLASKNYIASPVGIYAGNGKNVTITADKVDVVTSGYSSGNSLTNAIWNDGGKNTASQIIVNGDVNISMSGGYGGNGVAIQKSFRWGENSQESTVSSAITIHGNLKIAGEDSATWGIPVNQENVLSRFNNAGILTNIEKSKVTVTGDVDMAVYGNGITTNAVGSEVSIGGGHITVPQGTKYGYYTLGAYVGTINVNMNEAGSAAGTHDVQLDGDVFALKSTGTINLGLTTKNSYLNGIIDNGGKVNMWLQNGAVWTNEAKNTRYKQDDEDVGNNEISRVTFLHGGTKSGTGDTAGVIIQTANSKSLTIDKFSGAAKVLYSHDSNTPTKILGGDVTIGRAIRGSEIVLRTDYDDNMQSDAVKNQVLNALAEKLYYKDAVNGKKFLSGKVEIAEGLTASSVAKYTGNIAFNQTDGQGSFAGSGEKPEPPAEQSKTLFTSSITGGDDQEYKDDHVWQDQVYTFTKDKTTVQVEGGAAVDAVKDVTITADGNELDLTGGEAGIRAAAGKTVDITAGTLKVNGKTGIDAAGTVTLKGKSEITGTEKAVNVQKGGSVTLGTSTISGDVENSGHLTLDAATTVNGDITNAGVLAVNGETHAKDLTTTGTMTVGTDGVFAAENINVNGGTFTANGSVSSTVKADKGGKAILKGKKTALKGLVSGDQSNIEVTLSGKDSALNGSLDGAGSVTLSLADQANWTGNAVGNGAYAVTIGKDSTWTGSSAGNNTSLTLGGTWNNRGTSSLKQMAGNGGVIDMTDAKAGTVTIQNYGGSSTYIYKHDTTKPADANSGYAILGGDVKISHADKGSEITLLTDRTGLDFASTKADEKNLISGTLNALAGKLYYTGYADGNLSGTVKIAEGLTASSASLRSETITFSTADTGTKKAGQGFYDYTPEEDTKTYETGAIKKSENIGETRESDVNGLVSVNVTDAQTGVANSAPSALYASSDLSAPLVVDLQGHALQLSTGGDANKYLSTVYVADGKTIQIKDSAGSGSVKISAGVGNDGNADNKTNYTYGIQVSSEGSLISDANVEVDGVKSNGSSKAYGIYVNSSGQVAFNKDLTIKGVQNANKVGPNTAGIYLDSSANMTIHGNMDIENVAGYAIRAMTGATLTTSGGVIKAMDMANGTAYSNYYALFANKGTINLNTGDGITAGVLDMTGDMKVTDNAASLINVNLTKGSQWTGAASNIPSSTYNAPSGQINMTMAEGSSWTHQTGMSADTLKSTFAGSNISKLNSNGGLVYQNSDKAITVYNYSGDTTVVYQHDANDPLTIHGGDFTIKAAAADSKITLVTDSQGITGGFADGDTAAEKNHVKEVLNKLANKLFYTGYKDANLSGVVKIADGLTASSVSATVKASGDVTFSDGTNGTKKAGQGFYAYTPEQEKPNYKTGAITKSEDISLSRELDESGVAHVAVTESNVTSNFASALYAGESTSPSSPMTVKMSGKGLVLNAAQSSGQAAAIYAGANTYIKVMNPSADQKLTITATNTDTRASHGIYALGNAHLNISGPVEITEVITQGDSATGINIQGQQSEITIDGPLTISNVKGLRERGAGMSASGILVTGDSSTVTVSGPVDISGVRGSGILLKGKDTKVSVGGGTITAAEDSDKSHNFYAVRVDKGTLDINMKDGAAGDTTTKITGDMYATGQYGKKVVEYTGGELIDWNDAGILNVALTNDQSFWKGVAAYDMYNDNYGTGGNTAHDIGQFNLYLQNGATWTNEQQSHVTTTTIASKNPVWAGSTLATLHGGKDADSAGLIYQKDTNPISVVNYSGHTTVFYEHDANDPTKMIGGSFNITNAAEGSAITFITDNKGITSGFADGDSADAKDKVANVLNSLAGKLFYKNYTDGHLSGVVKIAEGLTASSAALKTGDISFSTEDTGTLTPGQGYYDYKTSKPGSQITKEFTTAITGDAAADTVYIEKGVLKDDGTYVFTADSTTITPEKHLIAGGAYVPQISAAISGSDETHNVTMDMNGNKLTVDTTTDTHTTGIAAIGKGVVNINNAGAMSVSATSTKGGQTGALFVNAGGTIQIHNAGADNVLTLRAKSTVPTNAAVIKSMNGVSGVMSAITVDGLVDILAEKSGGSGANEAISAVASKVEVGGGIIKAINGAEYAIRAYGEFNSKNRGQVNVNVKKDAKGAIIGAGSNTVQLEGNVYLGGGMDNAGASADVSLGLNTKDSLWKGDVSNTKGSSAGIVNLYMGNGATWTGNNLSGNTVNADLDHATWTGYSNGNAMHLTLDNSIWHVNGASKLASFSGDKGSILVASDAGDISVGDYSGNTTVIYNHDAAHPTNILGGSFTIGQAKDGSAITLITDNQGITKGFNAYDKAEDQNTVNEVLNKLAQKLFYTANDGKLAGTLKIAEGLTASSEALKTGNISFSTDATGTKTPGQGYYEYTVKDDSVITDPITGNLDKKYVNLGIETEKGIYNFTQDAVINVTKGLSELGAIESSGGPITIHADGKNLDVSYHVLKGSNVARAVATGLSYGKSKDVTITAKSLKLSTDTTGLRAQGVYATGGKITIDADTTISTSAQTESNGIYSGSDGTVTMSGNLTIQKDSKAANYIALKSDDNGVINVNMKDGKAGAGIVKLDGDIFTKYAESHDYWEDETTSTSSTVNLALQGKDSSWNGRSLYKVTSGDDSTSYGTFNLWLTDGATWTNEKNGKEVPSGFAGSHVTNFVGGADAAHAGHIFQNDSKNLTIDKYSGYTNIYYAHEGNGEAAENYKAGDTIIQKAAEGSVVSLITDNSGVSMDNEYSVANVLNALAGKLTYRAYVNGEKNLTGYVKIAGGLTASSQTLQTGSIAFSKKDGKGSYKDGTMTPGITYPDEQQADTYTQAITGNTKDDYLYKQNGVLKEEGKYTFTKDPTKIAVAEGAAVNAKADITIDTTKAKLELKGADAGINAEGASVTVNGNTSISGATGINAANGNVTLTGSTVINGTDAAINAGADANVVVNGNNSALTINGGIHADGGSITVDSGKATGIINGDVSASNGGSVEISLNDAQSKLTGSYKVDANSGIVMNIKNGATWVLTDDKDETAGMSLLRMAKAPAAASAAGLTVNGGATKADTGYIDMTKRTQELNISNYSGYETFILVHKDDGTFTSGDVKIAKAAAGSGMTLFTANNGINMADKDAVTGMLKALAKKAFYAEGNDADNGKNLTGEVKIGEGLTSSSAKTGLMNFAEQQGQLVDGSIQWEPTIEEGDYETFVMKGVRSAATTTFHSWRDNMQDTYTGADLADEDGIFAKALGGKTSSDVSGLKDSNSYWGAQIGYDKALAGGWHTGFAFDYRDGDSDYLLGGKGDNKLYSFGVYGVKKMEDGSYFRVSAKAGRVENEYDVYTELRNKLHADYKANAYGLTAEYGKTFGSEMSYITPKVQLTWSRVGSKNYTGSANNGATMDIYQDSYDSLIGRLGFEAGMKKAHGSLHAGLYLAHEFNGDINTRYFAKDGGWKSTSFDGDDTWAELVLGGEYRVGRNTQLYADFARDLGGDFQRKWKLNAGIRLRF